MSRKILFFLLGRNPLKDFSGGTTYAYDRNGNRVRQQDPVSGVTTFGYDLENRLVSFTPATGSAATYTYNGEGARVSKTVGSVATRYLYDGIEVAAELDAAGVVKAGYLHGPKIDELLCSRSSVTNTSLYHLTDHLGSTAMLTDSVRAAQAGFLYSAFGDLRQKSGSADTNWRFTGRQFDPESGLYHYRARGYDARAGRFLQRDPSGMVDGPNLYAYVGNNPWSFLDPLGLEAEQAEKLSADGLLQALKEAAANRSNSSGLNPWEQALLREYARRTWANKIPQSIRDAIIGRMFNSEANRALETKGFPYMKAIQLFSAYVRYETVYCSLLRQEGSEVSKMVAEQKGVQPCSDANGIQRPRRSSCSRG